VGPSAPPAPVGSTPYTLPVATPTRSHRPTLMAGPSGVGKSTLVQRLLTDYPAVWLSVSVTTRAPRPGEREGEHYYFVSDAEFDDLVAGGALLEWAVYNAARYGTPAGPVRAALAAGKAPLLEIDLAGVRQARRRLPDARTVLVVPPSREELARRLARRGTEDPEAQGRRLAVAESELAAAPEFDKVLVNDRLERALAELVDFMRLCAPEATCGRTAHE